MSPSRLKIAAAIVGMLLLSNPTMAQVATGTILGNVSDTSGGAVPGALVTMTQVDTQFVRTATTDESGQYALRLLPLGNYKVDVTLDGFKNFSQTGNNPGTNLNAPLLFGKIRAARDMRRIQLGARLSF